MIRQQTSTLNLEHYLKIAIDAAKLGGGVLKRYWGNLHQVRDKEIVGDIVTEADQESEREILTFLQRECSTHGVLCEESGRHTASSKEFLWVLDPLDGTVNYSHCYPICCVSIALLFQQHPVVGVIFNPFYGELFHAVKDEGAFLNGEALHVSSVNNFEQSLLATGFPYDRRQTKDNNYAEFCLLTGLTQGVRRTGSAALDLAYVAAGRYDAYWERGIKPWDVAAGMLLVQEAGGVVTDYGKKPYDLFSDKILASNGLLHDILSKHLNSVGSHPR